MTHERALDGRYAPSPSGELHLGNLRTAMAAWLFARRSGGRFVLRVDDLDPDRSRPEHEEGQLHDLRAIGIDWDGDPVRQSDRRDRYASLIAQLGRDGGAYPCFCSRADVRAAASAPHGPSPSGAYPGTCAALSTSESDGRVERGEPCCVRVRAVGASVEFRDDILGLQSGDVDDFIIQRRDGVAAYNLATVADDADLQIDQVVRGADLADSAPRQLWLARRLDLAEPTFAHVPLVLGSDGERLAKRHGPVGMKQLATLDIDAACVVGTLARSLGIDVGAGERPALAELVARFDPAQMPRGPVRISIDEQRRQLAATTVA